MNRSALLVLVVASCGTSAGIQTDAHNGSGDAGPIGATPDAAECQPGYIDVGAGCVMIDANDPAQRTSAAVCAQWAAGHVVTDAHPFTASGAQCDPGTLSQGGRTDTLTRIDMFRWLSGLGPTTDDAALDATDQKCANLESWWNFASADSPHMPPPTSTCYTADGASGAGMSNIAWGNSPSDSIDQFVEDDGNATTMGHRRWIVNPPLGPVGIGYWQGGGTYGSAECLAVFGTSGGGPTPQWVAVPNPGPVPLMIATWTWTFHSNLGGTANANIAIVRASDNASLAVTRTTLSQGYGQDAISWTPSGWTPTAGETYRVTVSGLTGVTGGTVSYAVKPVTCS